VLPMNRQLNNLTRFTRRQKLKNDA